jgi:hypothetical protein
MAMTDEQIKALRDRAATLGWRDVAFKPDTIAECCTRLLKAEARVKVLEDALQPFVGHGIPKQSLGAQIDAARAALQEQSK